MRRPGHTSSGGGTWPPPGGYEPSRSQMPPPGPVDWQTPYAPHMPYQGGRNQAFYQAGTQQFVPHSRSPVDWQSPYKKPVPYLGPNTNARNQYYYQQRPTASPTRVSSNVFPTRGPQTVTGRGAPQWPQSAGPFAASDDAATRRSGNSQAYVTGGSTASGGGYGGQSYRPPAFSFDFSRYNKLREQALSDALGAINASYAHQETTFDAAMGDLAAEEERLLLENKQAKRTGIIGTEATAAGRGLGHSGIYAEGLAELLAEVARQEAQVIGEYSTEEGNYGTRARDIESQRKLLGQQKAFEISKAKTASLREKLDLERMQAMLNAGMSV